MKLASDKARWYVDGDGFWVAFRTKDRAAAAQVSRDLDGKPWDVEAKPHREKRSLDANAYFWVLAGKLAARVGSSPDDVYRQYIRDVADNYVIQPVREDMLERWGHIWCNGHMGRMTEDLGPCRRTEGYHNVRCYLGSSDYDTAQMARLIGLVVEDCKAQGIETKTPQELAAMMEAWDG